jgi:hypothetical protein
VLDEAVGRLPDKYRVPFILHHLQGLAVAEVARRLACPQGTVAAHLARAKAQLRARLARRGLALSAGVLATALSAGAAPASVPMPLAAGAAEAATLVAAGKAAAGVASATAALAKGVLPMFLTKLKVAAAVLLTAGAVGTGVGLSLPGTTGGGRSGAGNSPTAPPAFERYYAGGFRSLRGFAFRGVGADVNGFKTGGDFLFLNSLEYQIPIEANDQFYFVPFVDSGAVTSRINHFEDYRVPAGAGVRVHERVPQAQASERSGRSVPGGLWRPLRQRKKGPFVARFVRGGGRRGGTALAYALGEWRGGGRNDHSDTINMVLNYFARHPSSSSYEDCPCAKKAWERGKRCNDYTLGTFRRSPVGSQSHPVEPGQQPEASLAWGGATRTAKRKQPGPRPCH